MRFAAITTALSAAIAVPLAIAVTAPSMSENEFISAVRCAAYEEATGQDIGAERVRLNAEARRQNQAIAAQAAAEVDAIAREAAAGEEIRTERAAACGAVLADGARAHGPG